MMIAIGFRMNQEYPIGCVKIMSRTAEAAFLLMYFPPHPQLERLILDGGIQEMYVKD